MHKPLCISEHYNQDFNPKRPVSQGQFTCFRASIPRGFQQDALNTKVTPEKTSNYSECITKASGIRGPVFSQSLVCYSGFSSPTQFAQQTFDLAL